MGSTEVVPAVAVILIMESGPVGVLVRAGDTDTGA